MASVPQIGAREKMLPAELKIEAFLSELAIEGNEAVSTQNQAFNALLFVYREVLGVEVSKIESVGAAGPARVPRGLPPEEARQVIVGMSGTPQLVVKLETCRSSGAWLNSGAVLARNMALLPELEVPSAAHGF